MTCTHILWHLCPPRTEHVLTHTVLTKMKIKTNQPKPDKLHAFLEHILTSFWEHFTGCWDVLSLSHYPMRTTTVMISLDGYREHSDFHYSTLTQEVVISLNSHVYLGVLHQDRCTLTSWWRVTWLKIHWRHPWISKNHFQECRVMSIYGRHHLIIHALFLTSSMVHKVNEKEVRKWTHEKLISSGPLFHDSSRG